MANEWDSVLPFCFCNSSTNTQVLDYVKKVNTKKKEREFCSSNQVAEIVT